MSASPAGGSYPVAQQVALTSPEFGADIYYTLDGTDPIIGDQLSTPEPLHYTGPITIDSSTTVKFAAFDPSNNYSTIVTESYNIGTDPVPAAPTAIESTSVGRGTVTLNWVEADAVVTGAKIVDYQVNVFGDAAALDPVKTVNTNGATSVTIAGLTGDTPYWFTVRAKSDANSAYGPASEVVGPWSPQVAVIANAGADQSGVVRNTTVTLSGQGSSTTDGTTYSWRQLDGSDKRGTARR